MKTKVFFILLLLSKLDSKISYGITNRPISAPSVFGDIDVTRIELVGRFPSNILCGSILARFSGGIPDCSNSVAASFDV